LPVLFPFLFLFLLLTNHTQATNATTACAAKLANQTLPSCPPIPASLILVLAMTPTELNGERLPALAPFATISAVRKWGTPARFPTTIARGIINATVEIDPGPTDASAPDTRKN